MKYRESKTTVEAIHAIDYNERLKICQDLC